MTTTSFLMQKTKALIGVFLMIALLFLLIQIATPQLEATFYPDGDFAADLLLVNELDSNGYLLKGHYSRFGFNHPGPAFFYINALFEKVGALFDLPRANAWILSTLLTNLAFLLLIAWLLPQLFKQRFSLLALAAVVPILVVMGSGFFNVWMPYRLILPFAAFYLSLLLLLKEGPRFLPLAMLLACVLIHGYVTMPLFTLPFLLLVTLLTHRHDSLLKKVNLRWIGLSLLIGMLFFLPMLVDLAINEQSNLKRIIGASLNLAGETSSVLESSMYTLAYWKTAAILLVPSGLLFLAIRPWLNKEQPSVIGSAIQLALLFSLVFALYHSTAPKPLYEFMGLYYLAVPLMLASVLFYTSLQGLRSVWLRDTFSLATILATLAWLITLSLPALEKREHIQRLGDFLAEQPGNRIAMDYPAHNEDFWPAVEGVLVYLKDRGVDACVARPELDFMYTPDAVCKTGGIDVFLDYAANCADGCLYTFDKFAVRRPLLTQAGATLDFPICQLPRMLTTEVQDNCTVSSDTPGFVTFGPYIKLEPGRYRVEIEYASPGNAQDTIGHWDISLNKGRETLMRTALKGTSGGLNKAGAVFVIEAHTETEIRTSLEPEQRLSLLRMTLARERD